MTNDISNSPFDDRCVVFLDILGFRESVKAASSDDSKAQKLDHALEKIQNLGKTKGSEIDSSRVTVFSDSVVISVNQEIQDVISLLEQLAKMLWTLMVDGVWMRGGITVGKLSKSPDRPWGPAFIEAYDTEVKLANYPRLVVSRKMIEWLNEHTEHRQLLPIKRDENEGVYFVDAIGEGLKSRVGNLPLNGSNLAMIKFHLDKEYIENTDNPNVFQKFAWLRKEWDITLGSHNQNDTLESYFSKTRQLAAGIGDFRALPRL